MSYIVVVWKISFSAKYGVSYNDMAYGPFRDDERAHYKKEQIERALKRRDIEGWGVMVEELITGSYAAGEIADWVAETEARAL